MCDNQISIPSIKLPELKPLERKRVPKTEVLAPILASRHSRIEKRNKVMTARYYYWTEIRRRRFDDIIRILADDEFFVEDRTVMNALSSHDDFYRELTSSDTTKRKLKAMFPGFDWE